MSTRTPLHWVPRCAAAVVLLAAFLFTTALARPALQLSLQAQIDQLEQRVVDLRELKATDPIRQDFLPRSQVRNVLEADLLEENSPEEIEANQVRWETLGYVEPGFDIVQVILDVLGEQVAGFYDPTKRSLYVVGNPGDDDTAALRPSNAITFAHEITHALQDQHFDIRAGQDARRTENDQLLAYQALVEGDAVLSQTLYAQRYLSQSELREALSDTGDSGTAALDRSPLVIRRELIFPYTDGVTFLLTPYRRGGWAAVDGIWSNPPSSTEQILHPEKYQAGEQPVALPLPDLTGVLGSDWRLLEETTLGELDWRILFEQYTNTRTAERVGTGWGGDRYQLFKRDRDGAVLLAARTAWDSAPDADEFFAAYPELAAGRHGSALQQSTGPDSADGTRSWSGVAGPWQHALTARGDRVSLVISTDAATADAVAAVLQP